MKDDTRIALLEQSIGHINQTLIRIEKRLDTMDAKIDARFDSLNNRIWNNFLWIIGGFTAILGILAHALHWI